MAWRDGEQIVDGLATCRPVLLLEGLLGALKDTVDLALASQTNQRLGFGVVDALARHRAELREQAWRQGFDLLASALHGRASAAFGGDALKLGIDFSELRIG